MGLWIFLRRKYEDLAFSKLYWTTISMEFLERGAYYTLLAVLCLHLAYNLGLSNLQIGILSGELYLLLSAVPIFGGAFAERIGYKTSLRFSLVLICSAYFLLGAVSILAMYHLSLSSWSLFGIIFIIYFILGIGAGSFKPVISATVAKTSSKERRSLAYMTYYWFINLGGFLFPLITALVFLIVSFGVPDERIFYYYICFVAGLLIIINYMIGKLKYKNPDPPNKDSDMLQPLRNILIVMKDRRFVLFLLIYSGFFVMFSTMHITIPLYMEDFHIMPTWFSVLFLATINPGAIILFGPYLSRFSHKFSPLTLIIFGLLIYLLGLYFMGIAALPFFFILGIVIFSCGEFLAHPNYSTYISLIAPRDKFAIYMGAAFLPSAIGYLVGGIICHGILYEEIAAVLQRPKLYWGIIVSIGLVTAALLWLFKRVYGKRDLVCSVPDTHKKLSFVDRTSSSGLTVAIVLILIPCLITIGYIGGNNIYYRDKGEGTEDDIKTIDLENFELIQGEARSYQDYATEGQSFELIHIITETNVCNVIFRLIWTDEEDTGWIGSSPNHENKPDTFTIEVNGPDGKISQKESDSNEYRKEGLIEFSVSVPVTIDPSLNGTGDWGITIDIDAGDHEPKYGDGVTFIDQGNDFTLEILYEFYQNK